MKNNTNQPNQKDDIYDILKFIVSFLLLILILFINVAYTVPTDKYPIKLNIMDINNQNPANWRNLKIDPYQFTDPQRLYFRFNQENEPILHIKDIPNLKQKFDQTKSPHKNLDLTKQDIINLQRIQTLAKQYPTDDNTTFEQTLLSIFLTETALGRASYQQMNGKPGQNRSVGYFQIKPLSAKFIIKQQNLTEYSNLTQDEIRQKLISDFDFQIIIATNHLVYNYNRALQDKPNLDPHEAAISKYNGGWHNIKYINRVKRNEIILTHLISTYFNSDPT